MVNYPVNLWRTTQWIIYSMIDEAMDPLLYDTLWYKVQGVLSTMVDNPNVPYTPWLLIRIIIYCMVDNQWLAYSIIDEQMVARH